MSSPADLAALLARRTVAAVLAALDGDGEETRIVGGAVRNTLLGRAVSDIDLATTATPDVTVARARAAGFRAVPTGIEHGTVTVVVDGLPFEVTTLREDVETDGRHARVRFGRSFEADAARRDFTINALSLGRDGRVQDNVGGLPDLAQGRVRFIGDARTRIREDFLRVLRFFRFHAEYGAGALDPAGLSAAIAERDGLATLSAERVRAELLKLLAARQALPALAALSESGLLLRLIGGVGDLGRFARAAREDGTERPARAGPDPMLRLAALAIACEEDAERLRERLRLANAERDRVAAFARLAARLHGIAELDVPEMRRLAFAHGAAPLADALGVLAGEPRPRLDAAAGALARRYASGREAAPVFRLGGRDLLAAGLAPGPEIGRRLAVLREAWLAQGCPEEPRWTNRLAYGSSRGEATLE